MCVAHSTARPAAPFNDVSLCPLDFIPNITGLLRPGIKPGPPACQLDALTSTLPAPLVMKFQMLEQLRWVHILHKYRFFSKIEQKSMIIYDMI